VTELTWLLSVATGMGLLERAHSYKDKIRNGLKPSVGLFTYPVLMAADILIYKSQVVRSGRTRCSTSRWRRTWRSPSNAAFKKNVLVRPEHRSTRRRRSRGRTDQKIVEVLREHDPDLRAREEALEVR